MIVDEQIDHGARRAREGSKESGRTRRHLRGRWALCFGLLLLHSACALTGLGTVTVPPEQRAAYEAAMGRLSGDRAGATAGLERFLTDYPTSPLADDATEQLSKLSFESGRQAEGMVWLQRLVSRYPDSDRIPAAKLQLAQLEFARSNAVPARSLLANLDLSKLDAVDRLAALQLRVDLAQSPVERIESLGILRAALLETRTSIGSDTGAGTRAQARLATIDSEMDTLIQRAASAELEEMIRGLKGRPPAVPIALELCRRALDQGDFELAERRIRKTEGLVSTEADRRSLESLRLRLEQRLEVASSDSELPSMGDLVGGTRPRTDGARGTLGVVLPLSGDFADYGQQSLRGVLLASNLFSETNSQGQITGGDALGSLSEMRILVRDSEGDAEKAAAAVRELAGDSSVVAILGPIFTGESLAAAEAAEEVGVPLVALSTQDAVAADRSQAFRTRTTPVDEVNVLVDHAFKNLEAKRFAVLYPQTRYGRGMRKLYWDAVTERGGKMVAASSYDPKAVDFSTSIRNMIGYRFLTRSERKALAEREQIIRASRRLSPSEAALIRKEAYSIMGPEGVPLPPIVDFDVLFIPDAADKIALIGPGLAFHEITGVGLLGSSDWVDDELPRVGRQHVSGAIVSTPFYLDSEVPFVSEFVDGYRATFASEPDAYAAEAFDATNLVLVQLSAGRTSRQEVREGLLDTRAYPGATGVLTMHSNGNARRRPFLLKISRGRFQPVD